MRVIDVASEALRAGDPDGPALVSGTEVWSARELDAHVSLRAEALGAEVADRSRVRPLVVEPDPRGVVELLATWRLRMTPALLSPRLTESERDRAEKTLAAVPSGAQAVLWTSGTAGHPRGVELGSEGLRAHIAAAGTRLSLSDSDVWLASLAFAHVGGLALVIRALLTGATLVTTGPLNGRELAEWLGRGPTPDPHVGHLRVTHLSLVPTQLARLLAAWGPRPAPKSVRCVLIGGAHAPSDLVDTALRWGWPLALTYGMTEMWSQVATACPEEVARKVGSVGQPLEGVEVRIADSDEILVRGPMRALGYVGDGPVELTGEDGWYHTGDLGRFDEDGDLWITGRSSDRIVSGGFNVDPAEVEDALRAHPTVVDVAVVGIPSREWGETVAAVVVPVWGEFELAEVEAFARAHLSGPKRPRVWKIEPDLPRNANSKLDRAAVRSLFTTR